MTSDNQTNTNEPILLDENLSNSTENGSLEFLAILSLTVPCFAIITGIIIYVVKHFHTNAVEDQSPPPSIAKETRYTIKVASSPKSNSDTHHNPKIIDPHHGNPAFLVNEILYPLGNPHSNSWADHSSSSTSTMLPTTLSSTSCNSLNHRDPLYLHPNKVSGSQPPYEDSET